MKITKFKLELQDLIMVLANALYGSEWSHAERVEAIRYTKEQLEEKYGNFTILDVVCFEDKLAADLMDGKEIIIIDHSDDDASYRVTLDNFEQAVRTMMKENPETFVNFLQPGDFDHNDADYVLQLAVFGEQVY